MQSDAIIFLDLWKLFVYNQHCIWTHTHYKLRTRHGPTLKCIQSALPPNTKQTIKCNAIKFIKWWRWSLPFHLKFYWNFFVPRWAENDHFVKRNIWHWQVKINLIKLRLIAEAIIYLYNQWLLNASEKSKFPFRFETREFYSMVILIHLDVIPMACRLFLLKSLNKKHTPDHRINSTSHWK